MPGNVEYPEWLVERVAIALYDADHAERGPGGQTVGPISKKYHTLARAVLDALGFTKNYATCVRWRGKVVTVPSTNPNATWHSRWIAQTEWKEVEE